MPATTATDWQHYPERWCAPCQHAFKRLVADHQEQGALPAEHAHPTD